MAVIINKRSHHLQERELQLVPGENVIPDELWAKAKAAGTQCESWLRLNWLHEKRSLPLVKNPPVSPASPPASPPQPKGASSPPPDDGGAVARAVAPASESSPPPSRRGR